jgi:hypothetical protein
MFSEEAINTQIQPQLHRLVLRKNCHSIGLCFLRFISCKAEKYAKFQHRFIDSRTTNSLKPCDGIITICWLSAGPFRQPLFDMIQSQCRGIDKLGRFITITHCSELNRLLR